MYGFRKVSNPRHIPVVAFLWFYKLVNSPSTYCTSQIEASTSPPRTNPVHLDFWKIFVQISPSRTEKLFTKCPTPFTGKNNGFPILDIFGYLKNTHKNPKFGKVRQIPIREFPTKLPNWDLSLSPKFGIFVGIP